MQQASLEIMNWLTESVVYLTRNTNWLSWHLFECSIIPGFSLAAVSHQFHFSVSAPLVHFPQSVCADGFL